MNAYSVPLWEQSKLISIIHSAHTTFLPVELIDSMAVHLISPFFWPTHCRSFHSCELRLSTTCHSTNTLLFGRKPIPEARYEKSGKAETHYHHYYCLIDSKTFNGCFLPPASACVRNLPGHPLLWKVCFDYRLGCSEKRVLIKVGVECSRGKSQLMRVTATTLTSAGVCQLLSQVQN